MMESSTVLVCPTCGEDLDDEAAACSFCRHELPAWVTRPAVQFAAVAPAHDVKQDDELPTIKDVAVDFGTLASRVALRKAIPGELGA